MKLTDTDKKMVDRLRKRQKQSRVNRQFGLIMLPIAVLCTIYFAAMYHSVLSKIGDDDAPFLSTIQFQGMMLLVMGGSGIIGMIKLIIGDRHENTINSLLLRLVDGHEKENSQQEDDAPSGTNP
jgi:hypothetical protein